jgi:hypothetical protein
MLYSLANGSDIEYCTSNELLSVTYQITHSHNPEDLNMESKTSKIVGFVVFTAVTMKNVVFWDVVPCRSCVNQRFGGTCHIHLRGRKIRERGTNVSWWLAD